MTIQEIEQRLEVMEQVAKAYGIFKEEVEQLQKTLAELKESKKEGKWKPAHREKYFYRDTCGDIGCTTNVKDNWDIWRINNLPVFPTKEACERYWCFMDTVKEKSYEFCREELEDTHIAKYFIKYDFDNKEFAVDGHRFTKVFNAPYFKTEEDAKYIIDNFKDELMEYWI